MYICAAHAGISEKNGKPSSNTIGIDTNMREFAKFHFFFFYLIVFNYMYASCFGADMLQTDGFDAKTVSFIEPMFFIPLKHRTAENCHSQNFFGPKSKIPCRPLFCFVVFFVVFSLFGRSAASTGVALSHPPKMAQTIYFKYPHCR